MNALIELEDAETGELRIVDTQSAAVREAFAAAALSDQDALLTMLRRNKVDHIALSTGRPFADDVRQLFRKRQSRSRRG